MVTVACVYKPGNGFSDDYVYRLKKAVDKYSTVHSRFVCLTNQTLTGIECLPLLQGWYGYWNKLELFRPGLFSGRVVYLDLDTMILDDVSDIFSCKSLFACPTNWKGPEQQHISSAVMLWDSGHDFSHLYTNFRRKYVVDYEKDWARWGDQGWVQDHLGVPFASLHALYPGRIVHYKINVRKTNRVPRMASIVCFSGKPRPHAVDWKLPPRA